jgi:hypothetical protein
VHRSELKTHMEQEMVLEDLMGWVRVAAETASVSLDAKVACLLHPCFADFSHAGLKSPDDGLAKSVIAVKPCSEG